MFPQTVRESFERPRQARLAQQDLDISGYSPLVIPSDVVDEQLLFGVSDDIAQTPILIPSESGLFEITAYAVCTVLGAAVVSFWLIFNDGVLNHTVPLLGNLGLAAVGNYVSSPQIIRASENSTVFYSVDFDVPGGSLDLWIRVKPV